MKQNDDDDDDINNNKAEYHRKITVMVIIIILKCITGRVAYDERYMQNLIKLFWEINTVMR